MSLPPDPIPIDLGGKTIEPAALLAELQAAAVPAVSMTIAGDAMFLFDAASGPIPDSPQIQTVLAAHVPPPVLGNFAEVTQVHTIDQTANATPKEVFRFTCQTNRMYESELVVRGVDQVGFITKRMAGHFVWKRLTGNAVVVGVVVVSDIHETAAAAWAPNIAASGTDIVFTVTGAAGRTIDWLLSGTVGGYAPGGLAT